jgi:hypothetical protein
MSSGLIPFRESILMVYQTPRAGVQSLTINYPDLLLPGIAGEVRSVRAWVERADTVINPASGFELSLSVPTAAPAAILSAGVQVGQSVAEGQICATGPSGPVIKDGNTLAIEFELGERARQFTSGIALYAYIGTTLAVVVGAQARIRVVVGGWRVAC